jgi:hypothetical protein
MALSKKNIIVGAARVYLGPSVSTAAEIASPKPAYVNGTRYSTTLATADGSTATGDPTLVTNWNEVGFTMDGLSIVSDPSWGEVEVDQLLDSARIFKDGMTQNVSTTFAEATLENLLIAWGQASSSLSSVSATEREWDFDSGVLGETPLERGLIAVGNGVENATGNTYSERVYHWYRVLSVESTTLNQSRSEANTIPVTFRALPADNGKYGKGRERKNVS